jgi:hypothetical protein
MAVHGNFHVFVEAGESYLLIFSLKKVAGCTFEG